MRAVHLRPLLLALAAGLASCVEQQGTSVGRDPFVTYIEQFGFATASGTGTVGTGTGTGSGTLGAPTFRRNVNVTLENSHNTRSVETLFLAWVELGSLRSGEEQDALLADGYVQLTRTLEIGSVYALAPGTFVYNGNRTTSPARVRLGSASADTEASVQPSLSLEFITPDVILVYSAPPTSCDSVAFTFDDNGQIDIGPSSGRGGYKTLAQVDVYQCDPLRPGVFYQSQGGGRTANQFFEGSPITFVFSEQATNGAFATVTIGNN